MNKIQKIAKKEYLFILCLFANFFLLPLSINGYEGKIVSMLIFTPFVCFVGGVIKGIKEGFAPLYIGYVPILFLTSVCFFYQNSAASMAIIFMFFALLGNIVGIIIQKIISSR